MFEGDGEEAVDTLPGDLVLVLRQKPHPQYRRAGTGQRGWGAARRAARERTGGEAATNK